ncbi:MAG: gluconate 2-dehydrogenase subunit 3 family protein [Methylobacteriaceae bacterium]|nr:gluconate 2-dehydrogenase subunit 3 family protein [Methylobacteriaceae bacterium]
MRDLYPGYDVLAKRNTPSWNEQTRDVIDRRVAIALDDHRFFSDDEWPTVRAICDRIVPQRSDRVNLVPVAALLDQKMDRNDQDGYRDARLPDMREAWQRGLVAFDAEARNRHGRRFSELASAEQDALLHAAERGELKHEAWQGMPPELFFHQRIISDVVSAYYSHPTAWSEIGWGGPASPRGYVRMNFNRRDSWEAAEARPGHEEEARRENLRVGR